MERVLSSTAAGTSAAWQAQQRRQPRAPTGPAAAQVAPPRRGGGAAGRRGLGVRVYAIKPIHVAFQAEVERRGLQTELSPQQQQQLSPSQKDAVGHANKLCCPITQQGIWDEAQAEALHEAACEPQLAGLLHSSIISHKSLAEAMAFVLANKLSSAVLLSNTLLELFQEAYRTDPKLVTALYVDLQAVMDRDPACQRYIQPVLYFKGYQALQAHRLAHHFWERGRQTLAIALQSQVSQCFAVDIHPAARIGTGILIDHATGVVIGETAVIGDHVSILHGVTLGGTGSGRGDRHPKVGNGVLLGAGVTVLGNIKIGENSKVGAGSVVLHDVPPGATAVGIPARAAVRKPKETKQREGATAQATSAQGGEAAIEPALTMDQSIDDWLAFDWVI